MLLMSRMLELGGQIGFPLLVKAVKGGGGKGMKLATSAAELPVWLTTLMQGRTALLSPVHFWLSCQPFCRNFLARHHQMGLARHHQMGPD